MMTAGVQDATLAPIPERLSLERNVRECLEIDLQVMVDTAFPECQRRLRQIIYDRGFITAAAAFLIEEYGERVRWRVTAWGSLRLVVQPDVSGHPGRPEQVVKLGMIIPSPPQHPRVLCASRTWVYGRDRGARLLGAEIYPLADILGSTDLTPYPEVRAEIETMRTELHEAGLDTRDVVPTNIGFVEGRKRLVMVDNELRDIYHARYPRYGDIAGEDEAMDAIDRLVDERHAACLEAQRAAGDRQALAAALARYQELMDQPDVFATVLEQAVEADVRRTRQAREAAIVRCRDEALAAAEGHDGDGPRREALIAAYRDLRALNRHSMRLDEVFDEIARALAVAA